VRDLSNCGSNRVIYNDEVVVGIQRKFGGIERAFLHPGRPSGEFFSEGAARGEQHGSKA
jgi:hypothetical protein